MARVGIVVASAILSAILFTLSLPLGEQFYLAWFAFVPLLMATRGRGLLWGFAGAILTIAASSWLSCSGFLYRIHQPDGNTAWVYTGIGIFGFAACIALSAWGDKSTLGLHPLWFAALATLAEAFLLFELPANLALTQYRQSVPLTIASVGGVWLVSFLLWLTNFWLASLPIRKAAVWVPAIAAIAFMGSFVSIKDSGQPKTFATIQTDEPQKDQLVALYREASASHPVLVVWPELSGMAFVSRGDAKSLKALSREPGSAPFITTFRDDFDPLPHNTEAVFSNGGESERYYKRKLFGGEVKMHTSGSRAVAASYAGGQVGLNICYDSCFPEIIRDTARLPGVNLIVDPSLDPDAANHFMSAMHAAYTPFRAAEEGVAFIKADGQAFSQLVDSYGNIVCEAPPKEEVFVGQVSTSTHWTPYRQFGDWVFALCIAILIGGPALAWRGSRRTSKDVPRKTSDGG
jgi:apolipoprotein N-acyltransferase